MKHYLDLVPISARIHRKQNKMSIICIVLAVFLVTTIFGMADMFIRSQTIQARIDGGDYHIAIKDITDEQVETLNFIFNNKLKGKPLDSIDKPLEEYIFSHMNYSLEVIKPVMEQLNKVINEEEKIYLEGANKAFDLPEFKSLEIAKNFINVIDQKEIVADLLNTGFANDINVYIGSENDNEKLKDFSIVTFKHRYKNKDLGTIGIIGPTRMDYSKVISVMKYISKKLNGE